MLTVRTAKFPSRIPTPVKAKLDLASNQAQARPELVHDTSIATLKTVLRRWHRLAQAAAENRRLSDSTLFCKLSIMLRALRRWRLRVKIVPLELTYEHADSVKQHRVRTTKSLAFYHWQLMFHTWRSRSVLESHADARHLQNMQILSVRNWRTRRSERVLRQFELDKTLANSCIVLRIYIWHWLAACKSHALSIRNIQKAEAFHSQILQSQFNYLWRKNLRRSIQDCHKLQIVSIRQRTHVCKLWKQALSDRRNYNKNVSIAALWDLDRSCRLLIRTFMDRLKCKLHFFADRLQEAFRLDRVSALRKSMASLCVLAQQKAYERTLLQSANNFSDTRLKENCWRRLNQRFLGAIRKPQVFERQSLQNYVVRTWSHRVSEVLQNGLVAELYDNERLQRRSVHTWRLSVLFYRQLKYRKALVTQNVISTWRSSAVDSSWNRRNLPKKQIKFHSREDLQKSLGELKTRIDIEHQHLEGLIDQLKDEEDNNVTKMQLTASMIAVQYKIHSMELEVIRTESKIRCIMTRVA